MNTYTRTLSETQSEAEAVECLGRVLSRCFDALSDMRVSAMIRATRNYSGAFGFSDAFTELDQIAPRYGVVWTYRDDRTFKVYF